jgi:hypothetical protein
VWSSLHADSSMPSSQSSTKCISVITYRASNIWWVQSMTIMSLKYHDSEVFLQSEVGSPLWEKMEILAVFQFLNGCFMWQQEVKYVFSIQWYKSVLLSITTTHILITYIYRRWTAKAAANFHMDHNWWFLWLDVPLHYLQFIVAGLKSGLWYTDAQPSVVLLFWLLLIYMATSPVHLFYQVKEITFIQTTQFYPP